jgi:hypothetical protein
MKKILFLISLITIISCSQNHSSNSYVELNSEEYKNKLNNINTIPKELVEDISNYLYNPLNNNTPEFEESEVILLRKQKLELLKINEFEIEDISEYYTDVQKKYLFKLYSNIYNDKINLTEDFNNLISEVDNLNASLKEKEELKYQIITFEKIIRDSEVVIEQILNRGIAQRSNCDAYFRCIEKNLGRQVSQAMVGGALIGALNGGLIGAAGGTVILPFVGTATGAVGGAVFGGAKGAIQGAIVGAFWTLANCMKTLSKECLNKLFAR